MSDETTPPLSQLHAQLHAQFTRALSISTSPAAQDADPSTDLDAESLNDIRREVTRLSELVEELGQEVQAQLVKRVDESPPAGPTPVTED